MLSTAVLAALGVLAAGLPERPPAPAAVDWQRDVRPLLADRCFACHGPDASSRKAELRLDQRGGVLGVVDPARPEASQLLARVATDDPGERMPPPSSKKAPLSADEVELLRRWIAEGVAVEQHWSLKPVARPSVPDAARAIDDLLRVRQAEAGVQPAPRADRRTLIRRLSFDLLGLPPTPSEVDAFVADERPDAYERLVERLLASPHHGERMAQWWLDLVRYGDSSGYHSDRPIPVWPYRDWVLRAFASNLPFDVFTVEQLAGDLLPDAGDSQRVASIYNRLNKTTDEGGAQAGEYVVKYAADRVRTTASVWLGATMGCAECHNHKYDPLEQRDFYRLAAFFADIEEVGVYEHSGWREFQPRMEVATAFGETTCLATVATGPRVVRVLPRGNWLDESGEVVAPGTPECWPPLFPPGAEVPERATRLDLARWLVRGDHPATARVLVNRLWYLFFGEGLSAALDDVGRQGEYPSHPALLDWLAAELVDSGWDVRHVVRRIVLSEAYRQSSRARPELAVLDPGNRLVARQGAWRLDAEQVRDNALAVSGLLRHRIGGPSVKPYQPAGYWDNLNFPARDWVASTGDDQHRRGLYTHWQRTFVHPGLLALDAPTREETTARRVRSNTPLAALALLNGPTWVEAARALAAGVLASAPADDGPRIDEARVDEAFARVLQRAPSADERATLVALAVAERRRFAQDPAAARALLAVGQEPAPAELDPVELAAWTQAARALLNLHETITRR